MKIKFKKTLTLSLLASMVIAPTVSLAMNFNNESVSNVENNALNAREVSNNTPQDNKSFEDGIAGVISALNTNYESNKTKNAYFSDEFMFDLGLSFNLIRKKWTAGMETTQKIELKSPVVFNNKLSSSSEIMLNNESIKNRNDKLDNFDNGRENLGGHIKDPNLKLSFNNTANHKEKGNLDKGLNQIGSIKNITSTYNSNFNLSGKLKDNSNDGNRIMYAANGTHNFGEDYYLEAILNDNLVNGTSKFFKPNSIKPQSIDRWVDVFSEEDSLKIFNMIFDNNYLPEAVNADGIKTSKDLTNEFGKMIKFSDDFKVLKSISDLSNNIELLNSNLKKHGTDGNLKPHLDIANMIIENLNKGLFNGSTIADITAKLKYVNTIDAVKPNLVPLIEFITGFNINNTLLNKEFSDLSTNLILHGLLLNNENNTINNINFLYERLIGWLSVNNISFNINGLDHIVFKNGVINNLKDTLDIFKDDNNTTITKEFVISEVKINRIGDIEYNKNIFTKNVVVNSNLILNDALNKVQGKFLTGSNYKIAYSYKDNIKEIKENTNSLARSIPVSMLDKNLSEYLQNIDGNVEFTDKTLWEDVNTEIIANIFKLNNTKITNQVSSESMLIYENLLNDLNWDNGELLKILDFEGSIDEPAKLLLKEKLTNQHFNDEDGIFYSIATIPFWNGEEAIVGNEKYIGHYKEQEQKAFINSINKDGATNIIEIEPIKKDDVKGYFILKLRTMKNSYTENAKKYDWIMKNFNKVFEPKIDVKKQTEAFSETTFNKIIGYKMKWEYIEQNFIPKKAINGRDEFFINIEKLAANSSSELFNYENIIFNDKTIKYKSEINPELKEINKLVVINKGEMELLEKTIETPNVLHIMSLIISLFVGIIIVSIITIKILQDKKIDKELNSKGINKKRYVKN